MEPQELTKEPGSSERSRDLIAGQKLAFAAASLAVGICAYISLLGMEKAILAIIFGVLALRNHAAAKGRRRTLAWFGILLGVLHIVLLVVLIVVFREPTRFFEYLERCAGP